MSDYLDYLHWLSNRASVDEPKPSQAVLATKEFSPFVECLILASQGDDLSALIGSRALEEIDQSTIIEFCQAKAQKADAVISDVIASAPAWVVRRKARNVQRRLLRALLYKHADFPLQASKGAKYRMLLNLAKSKGLLCTQP